MPSLAFHAQKGLHTSNIRIYMKVFWIISEQIKREKRERDRSVRLLVTSVLAVGVLIKSTGSDFVPSLRDRVDPAASQDLRLCLCVCNIPN